MFTSLDEIIKGSIREGFPSGQIVIQFQGKVIRHDSYGYSSFFQTKATQKTLYDIASLTKIFALTYAFQSLVSLGKIALDDSLSSLLGEQNISSEKSGITIRALLSHTAGFEPNPLFYDEQYSKVLYCQERAVFLDKLLSAPLIYPPNQKALYSDVDFMLLTFILERCIDMRIDQWLMQYFWKKMGLTHIAFAPLSSGWVKTEIAATERHGNSRDYHLYYNHMRTNVIWGEVQDEKAYHCMEQYSGHAGLFANAETLLALFNLMRCENPYFSQEVKAEFLAPSACDASFGLGWRLNYRNMEYMFGDYASSSAYGHTGWTGCLAMHDPKYDLSIIYLTNRKHTKVMNPDKNAHLFYGDTLPAGKYRVIVNSIYEALGLSK